MRHAGQAEPRAEIEQHGLERPHIAVGLDDRLADGIGRAIGFRDRPVEQRDAVPALEIGRVGQDEIGIVHHLRSIGVGIDDVRDDIFAGRLVLARSDAAIVFGDIHRRVPAHIRHVEEEHVDRDRDRAWPHWRSPCASGHGRRSALPRNRPCRCAAACHRASTSRSSGAVTKPSGGPGSARVGLDLSRLAGGLDAGRRRLGKRRLVAKPPGTSMVPRRICRRCRMRQVWKPFEWAEMPRIACIETGRPIMLSWIASGPIASRRYRAQISSSKAVVGQFGGDAADRVGLECRSVAATGSGEYSSARKRSAMSWKDGTARRPSAKRVLADELRRRVGTIAPRAAGRSPRRRPGRSPFAIAREEAVIGADPDRG